jgi:hypothetical protein
MKKYHWFKTRRHGWGWTPTAWQGWAIFTTYIVVIVIYALLLQYIKASDFEVMINFIPRVFILTALLIIICYQTGEKPSWHWGNRK